MLGSIEQVTDVGQGMLGHIAGQGQLRHLMNHTLHGSVDPDESAGGIVHVRHDNYSTTTVGTNSGGNVFSGVLDGPFDVQVSYLPGSEFLDLINSQAERFTDQSGDQVLDALHTIKGVG